MRELCRQGRRGLGCLSPTLLIAVPNAPLCLAAPVPLLPRCSAPFHCLPVLPTFFAWDPLTTAMGCGACSLLVAAYPCSRKSLLRPGSQLLIAQGSPPQPPVQIDALPADEIRLV